MTGSGTPSALEMIADRVRVAQASRQQAMGTAAALMAEFPGAEVRAVPLADRDGLEALLPGERVTGDAAEVREWLSATWQAGEDPA